MSRVDLRAIPLLALMPDAVRELVEASFVPVSYGFGETIVREGEPAGSLFVIVSGSARAAKATPDGHEVPLSVLRPGDVFGELALLRGGARTATVRASGVVEALRLDRAVFDGLVRTNPAVSEWVEGQAERHELFDLMRLHSTFAGLPSAALAQLLVRLEPVDVAAGTEVIHQDEAAGAMFMVKSGRLRVTRSDGAQTVTVGVLRRGDVFGERALLLGEPRAATVQALTDCELLSLAPEALATVMGEHVDVRRELQERIARYDFRRLAHVPLDFAQELLPVEASVQAAAVTAETEEELRAEEAAEEAAADEVFRRPARRIRRFATVWQIDEADCGAACLAAVCRHFGRDVPLTVVRDAVGTALDGTSLRGLVVGAERLGLAARSIKVSRSRLDGLALPAICHWRGNHWLVLHDVTPRFVRVSDPATGPRRMARTEWDEHFSGFCCLVAATPALAEQPVVRPAWRWLAPFFRPHRRMLVVGGLLALAAASLQMLIPVAAGVIVDNAIADRDRPLLHLLAMGMLGMLLAAVSAAVVQRWLLARLAVRFDAQSLDHVTERLLALPASYFATRRTGDIERRITGMRQVRLFLVQQGVVGLTGLIQILVAVALMFILSPLLAAVYLVTMPLYLLGMVYSRRRLRPILSSLEEAFGRYHSRQIDAIERIETVKARGAEPALRRLLARQFDSLADRVYRSDLAFMRYEAAVQLVTFLTLALVLWAGGLLVIEDRLTIGELVAINGLVVLANGPVATVLLMWDELQYASVLLARLDDVLSQEPEQGFDHTNLQPVPTLGGRVSIQGVTVCTGGPAPVTILDDITLEIQPGETIALVGRSGAGKTTLVRCLVGLMPITSGRILYDGVDLTTLDHRQLRQRMGFVLQDDQLLDDTLAGNIALGEEVADMERVRWAARVADAAEFIERLPLGYETQVGESGLRLSGGQTQRVAIARAVYARPPILLLDEATSSLDTDSERAVKEGIDTLLEGRTAFIIAHRLSTVRNADRIVVLERGRVEEQGTHTELLERRGIYWYLISQQLEG
jgi:ABC-type bacteriocin/lantibiotic exporter with double-glycine peptidase domain/CRP-like cAMP-binding protein